MPGAVGRVGHCGKAGDGAAGPAGPGSRGRPGGVQGAACRFGQQVTSRDLDLRPTIDLIIQSLHAYV